MGIFGKKKLEAPSPNICVNLATSPDHIFRPNDTVSGHVALSTPYSITPQSVEVSLWGESKVWIRTSSSGSEGGSDYKHYRDEASLFVVTLNLFPTPYALLPDQTYSFPFNFRMPRGTTISRVECYKNPTEEPYTTLPHDLPPSFFCGLSEGSPNHALVRYGVTARLSCPSISVGREQKPVTSFLPILFHSLNGNTQFPEVSVIRYPQTFTLASSSLLGAELASMGFRKRMHDRLSSYTPKLDFEIGIELPDRLNSNQEFSFRTSFSVLSRTGTVSLVPRINLKILKVKLLDFTFFRAARDWSASNTMSGYQRERYPHHRNTLTSEKHEYRENKTLLNAVPEAQTMELKVLPMAGGKMERGREKDEEYTRGDVQTEQESRGEVWWKARVPSTIPPDFGSFAIARRYSVKVKLAIELGGKKFVSKAESHVQHLGS